MAWTAPKTDDMNELIKFIKRSQSWPIPQVRKVAEYYGYNFDEFDDCADFADVFYNEHHINLFE